MSRRWASSSKTWRRATWRCWPARRSTGRRSWISAGLPRAWLVGWHAGAPGPGGTAACARLGLCCRRCARGPCCQGLQARRAAARPCRCCVGLQRHARSPAARCRRAGTHALPPPHRRRELLVGAVTEKDGALRLMALRMLTQRCGGCGTRPGHVEARRRTASPWPGCDRWGAPSPAALTLQYLTRSAPSSSGRATSRSCLRRCLSAPLAQRPLRTRATRKCRWGGGARLLQHTARPRPGAWLQSPHAQDGRCPQPSCSRASPPGT